MNHAGVHSAPPHDTTSGHGWWLQQPLWLLVVLHTAADLLCTVRGSMVWSLSTLLIQITSSVVESALTRSRDGTRVPADRHEEVNGVRPNAYIRERAP